MAVRLLFFASCARSLGRRELELRLDGPATVSRLWARPELAPLREQRRHVLVAVNQKYAQPQSHVQDGDEVAFMPPVCGG